MKKDKIERIKCTKSLMALAAACLLTTVCHAQSFEALRDNKGKNPFTDRWGALLVRGTHLSGKYTEGLTAATINVMLRSYRYHKWGGHYRFENMLLGDGLYTIVRGFKRANEGKTRVTTDRSEQTISSGWVGAHQFNYNAIAQPRLLVAPGISAGDYTIATKRATNGQTGSQITDPAGYYFYAGPSVKTSLLLTDKIWLDGFVNYDFTLVKVANPTKDYTENPDYPLPTLLTIGVEVSTTQRLYGAFRYIGMLDAGSNKDKGNRIDLSFGYIL